MQNKIPCVACARCVFRDSAYFNYWGRVPAELIANGAEIYYGNHESAASVDDSAKEIAERIKQIVAETGCEKLNIIAHSKGGLDCRKAIACYGVEDMTASLTTINTPHRGCGFADYLLTKVSPNVKNKIAFAYNNALLKFGDKNPDFISAVTDLTQANCTKLNADVFDSPKVYYQSFGSKLNRASGGKFPLNFSYNLVKYFDGENDGLVSENSFAWGEKYTYITTKGKRGISHGDMIDLNRENIKDFDIREFYVQILADLKNQVIDKEDKDNMKRKDYISWDEYFMGVAILASKRSKDPNTQVGACIVDNNNIILSTGYNGFPFGCSDDDYPWCRDGEDTKYSYVVHAELNAILNARGKNLKGARLYVDLFPCNECAKAIIQSGIAEVVYLYDKYADSAATVASKRMLQSAGVACRKFTSDKKSLSIDFEK